MICDVELFYVGKPTRVVRASGSDEDGAAKNAIWNLYTKEGDAAMMGLYGKLATEVMS